MELWHYITEATVEVVVKYGSASDCPPRSAVLEKKDGLSFSFVDYGDDEGTTLTPGEAEEIRIVESIMDRSGKHGWDATLLDSRASFRGMVAHVKNSIETESQRSCGLGSVEFLDYIEEVEENVQQLISRLAVEELESLYVTIDTALYVTLYLLDPPLNIRRLQFLQKLRSKWVSDKSTLRRFDRLYHDRVQVLFVSIIKGDPYRGEYQPGYISSTAEEMEEVLALGADIRFEVEGQEYCCLLLSAKSRCPITIFKALVQAGAPYMKDSYNRSLLQAAAEADRIDILEFLLSDKLRTSQVDELLDLYFYIETLELNQTLTARAWIACLPRDF